MQVSFLFIGAGATVLASVFAFAQAPLTSDTSATVSPARLEYRSAFEGYRAYREAEARSWQESNEEAAALRGHVGQIKPATTAPGVSKPDTTGEAATAPAAPAPISGATNSQGPSAPPATKPASPGHEGHGK